MIKCQVNEENSCENLLVNFNCIMLIVSLYMTYKMCNNRNNVDLQIRYILSMKLKKERGKATV